jgi:hypothetical protein
MSFLPMVALEWRLARQELRVKLSIMEPLA